MTAEQRAEVSRNLTGRSPSAETRRKIGLANANRPEGHRKQALSMMGERNPQWRGGVTPENVRLRMSFEAREWARAVKERDNFTCQHCGSRSGPLHSDHIKPWALHPELRFDISNGRTLCVPCHRKTPTWGNKAIYRSAQVAA